MPTVNITQLALVAVFASVALLAGGIAALVLSRSDGTGRRRLRQAVTASSTGAVIPELLPLTSDGSLTGAWDDVARLLPRSKKEMNRLKLRMQRAGVEHPGAPVIYSIAELVLPIALAWAVYASGLLNPPSLWLAILAAAAAGYFAPSLWVDRQLAKRRRQIENGLPDALDLLVVCIEAGSGIDQAIVKTGEEISFAYPALGEEFRILNSEIRAGKTRIDAFKSLASRTKVDDVRALVAMLIQTDRFGTSIGQALRSHADTSRVKRRQRAEEAAQKIGVKLVFPLVLFFFPAFYVVVLGPAIITFVHAFG
jgi:tight adherence protein C